MAIWIGRAWRVWGVLAVVVFVAGIGSILPGTLDDRIRIAGMTLELLGIFTVAFGLKEKRVLFQRPSLLDRLRTWFKSRPRFGTQNISASITGVGGIGSASAFGRASVWLGTPPNASVEIRLATLEANILRLREEQSEIEKRVHEETRHRNEALKAEREERQTVTRELRTQLDTFGAGNLDIEAAGIFWLVVGVMLATASPEIAKGLKWFL